MLDLMLQTTIFGLLNNKITGDENIELCYWNY